MPQAVNPSPTTPAMPPNTPPVIFMFIEGSDSPALLFLESGAFVVWRDICKSPVQLLQFKAPLMI